MECFYCSPQYFSILNLDVTKVNCINEGTFLEEPESVFLPRSQVPVTEFRSDMGGDSGVYLE